MCMEGEGGGVAVLVRVGATGPVAGDAFDVRFSVVYRAVPFFFLVRAEARRNQSLIWSDCGGFEFGETENRTFSKFSRLSAGSGFLLEPHQRYLRRLQSQLKMSQASPAGWAGKGSGTDLMNAETFVV